ncbi:cupredoxin domain-containing protein [Rhodopseudomonas sp. HC1]|uniref:cupredoxin domain-containing protein n=1 Tax=Rhodopseudomonas infernalis TaxID=2897386 RepID=UPI001EE8C84E|nr:cupredoxin domain-containing protein [Rhodopseudomonas infernalis]MCG6204486.1 cupredoxin domain-containing protein [Rhodopseudomonas infernalis]
MRPFGIDVGAAVAGRGLSLLALLAGLLAWPIAGAHADDEPTFRIEFNDGKVSPQRIEVPALTRFKLDLHNLGREPAEFESKELRKEKVLAPGSSSILVIRTLDPGEYPFFDDFHLDAPPAVLIAK